MVAGSLPGKESWSVRIGSRLRGQSYQQNQDFMSHDPAVTRDSVPYPAGTHSRPRPCLADIVRKLTKSACTFFSLTFQRTPGVVTLLESPRMNVINSLQCKSQAPL